MLRVSSSRTTTTPTKLLDNPKTGLSKMTNRVCDCLMSCSCLSVVSSNPEIPVPNRKRTPPVQAVFSAPPLILLLLLLLHPVRSFLFRNFRGLYSGILFRPSPLSFSSIWLPLELKVPELSKLFDSVSCVWEGTATSLHMRTMGWMYNLCIRTGLCKRNVTTAYCDQSP